MIALDAASARGENRKKHKINIRTNNHHFGQNIFQAVVINKKCGLVAKTEAERSKYREIEICLFTWKSE